jgi:hypothetical protein
VAALPRLVNAFFPNFVDVSGGQANCMWTGADQSDSGLGAYSAVAAAAQALSVAGLFAGVIQTRSILGATPTSGDYPTVSDQVVFFVQSESSSGQIAVPAPVSGIFLSDNVTVDLENSLVTAWWGSVAGVLGDSYGNPWTQLKSGRRRKIRLAGT